MILHYCDRCGNLGDEFDKKCYCCGNSPLKPIPKIYIDNFRWRDGDGKQAFIKEVIKTSPNLDQYLFEHKDEIIKAKNDDMNAKIEYGESILKEQSCQPECPTCHSKNVQRISGIERGASIIGLGIFSKKINKSFKCKSCGYTW